MGKRVIAWVSVLVMVLSFMPAAAVAAGESLSVDGHWDGAGPVEGEETSARPAGHRNHKLCSDDSCTSHGQVIEFQPWEEDDGLPTEGNWYLTKDVTLRGASHTPTGDLTLCLNGKTVTQTTAGQRVINALTGKTLNITDCDTTGTLTGGTQTYGAAVSVRNGGVFNLYGGKITGNDNSTQKRGQEGTVYIQGGNGGEAGNHSAGGIFNLYGGEISGNATGKGGAISLAAPLGEVTAPPQVNIYGGKLTGNTSTGQGGAIHASGGARIHIENGQITGNTSGDQGGALYSGNQARITISNTQIQDNRAKNGSALVVYGGSLTLENVAIQNNHATAGYGALYMHHKNGNMVPVFKGDVVIDGNTCGPDMVEQNTFLGTSANGLFLDVSGLSEGAKIGLSRENSRTQDRVSIATLGSAAELARFHSDSSSFVVDQDHEGYLVLVKRSADEGHLHRLCSDGTCAHHSNETFQKWEQTDSLPTAGVYYLETDVELKAAVATTGQLTLCLNGHTIRQTVSGQRVFQVENGHTLNITDCGITGTIRGGRNNTGSCVVIYGDAAFNFYGGKITDNKPVELTSPQAGAAIFLHSGRGANATFNMYGGEITGNGSQNSWGGAVTNGSGKAGAATYVNLYGGKIYGNTAAAGGALRMENTCVVTIYDGQIFHNTAADGGAIYLGKNGPELRLQGGKIDGNRAEIGGGIYLHQSAKLTVSGAPIVYDNTVGGKQNNLHLAGTAAITLGDVEEAARIGISADTVGRAISSRTDRDYTPNFPGDSSKQALTYKDQALWIDNKPETSDHCHCACYGVKNDICDHTQHTWVKWGDDAQEQAALPTVSGYYYLTQDITLGSAVTMEANQQIHLCLNGKTVTAASDKRHFALATGTIMNITDCSETAGGFTGGSNHYGGSVSVTAGSTLNLFNGKFYGNQAPDNEGGAIYLQGGNGSGGLVKPGGIFNMYGGEITGNTAKAGAGVRAVGWSEGGQVGSQMNLYGGSIHENTATAYGGGVAITTGATMNVYGGTIGENTAESVGGGIYMDNDSLLHMQGGTITGNRAEKGGGVMVWEGATFLLKDGSIVNHTIDGDGGGTYVSTGATFTMEGGSISGNTARRGAGLFFLRSEGQLKGGAISGNYAKAKVTWKDGKEARSYGTAGAMFISGAKVDLQGTSMIQNKADRNGGAVGTGRVSYRENGVQKYDLARVNIYDGLISGNSAQGSGGGLLIQAEGTIVNMYGGTVADNVCKKNGGGIYVSGKSQFYMTGGSVIRNRSDKGGGGFYFLNATGQITGGQLHSNTATTSGGHIMISGAASAVTVKNVKFCQGQAKTGGALVVQSEGGGVTAENCQFCHNTGTAGTGGVYLSARTNGEFVNCQFDHNTAVNGSGAFTAANFAKVNITNCDFTENRAGTMGGAICTNPASQVTMQNTIVSRCSAGTKGGAIVCRGTMYLKDCVVENCDAQKEGGAFYTNTNTTGGSGVQRGLVLEDTQVRGNRSGGNGGGFYIYKGCRLELHHCQVTANTATLEGGAIWAYEDVELHNTRITGNQSGGQGYAVYMNDANYDGHSYFTSKNKLSGNVVIKDNSGGNLWMGPDVCFAITAGGLGQEAHLELTMDSGVVTQRILGAYHYEGGNRVYTITYGDRSMREPLDDGLPVETRAVQQQQKEESWDVLLYVGLVVLAVAEAGVLAVIRKKQPGKTAENANKEEKGGTRT